MYRQRHTHMTCTIASGSSFAFGFVSPIRFRIGPSCEQKGSQEAVGSPLMGSNLHRTRPMGSSTRVPEAGKLLQILSNLETIQGSDCASRISHQLFKLIPRLLFFQFVTFFCNSFIAVQAQCQATQLATNEQVDVWGDFYLNRMHVQDQVQEPYVCCCPFRPMLTKHTPRLGELHVLVTFHLPLKVK